MQHAPDSRVSTGSLRILEHHIAAVAGDEVVVLDSIGIAHQSASTACAFAGPRAGGHSASIIDGLWSTAVSRTSAGQSQPTISGVRPSTTARAPARRRATTRWTTALSLGYGRSGGPKYDQFATIREK